MKTQEMHIEVEGRVQGVGFRRFIKKEAESLGLSGTVCNKDNGNVHILAQGSRQQLLELVEKAQKGPLFSNVTGMSFSFQDIEEKKKGFEVIRDNSLVIDQKNSFSNLGRMLLGRMSVPVHLAIIPDGNRRWAQEKGWKSLEGVKHGGSYNHLKEIFEEARDLGIKYLSIWGFSTENWKRPEEEIKVIFDIILRDVELVERDALKNKIRFRHIGRKDRLPPKVVEALVRLEEKTKHFNDFHVQLCLDYGGNDELVRAFNTLVQRGIKHVDEKVLSEFLDSAGIPDVDFIVRTSGEQRLSGFMPFQSSYAEIYFTPVYFPDFGKKELREAIKIYSFRKRRFGK